MWTGARTGGTASRKTNVSRSAARDAGVRYDDVEAADRRRKPNTIRGYQTMVRAHLLPEFGRQLLTDISTEQIERWWWGIDCAASTRAKLIVCLGGISHRARKVWGITYDPVDDVERPTIRSSFDIDVYTPDEVRLLAAAATTERDAAIFLTAAFTGLRLGDLVALRWRDVDLEGWVLRVRASWSGTEVSTARCATCITSHANDDARLVAEAFNEADWG